jgi:hypothetical protein
MEQKIMEKNVMWGTSLEEGLKRAKIEKKTVFLDFFNPG